MILPPHIAALFPERPPVSSIQAAKATLGARLRRPITARLIHLPPDLRQAVRLLAAQYRKTRSL